MSSVKQTRYGLELYIVIDDGDQAALNQKCENRGYGPDTFTIGLSTSGSAPAQAYHSRLVLRREHLDDFFAFTNQYPRAWVWVRVRNENLSVLKTWWRNRIDGKWDLAGYRDPAWQTRSKAHVLIMDDDFTHQDALDWIAANASPPVSLQLIS